MIKITFDISYIKEMSNMNFEEVRGEEQIKVQSGCTTLKSKCIVLDLDLTMVHTILECQCKNHVEIEFRAAGSVTADETIPPRICKSYVHVRPFAFEFIRQCYERDCTFVIFSANGDWYINQVVNILFKDFAQPCHILTERDLVLDLKTLFYVKTLSSVSQKTEIPIDKLIAIDDNIYMYPYDSNVIRIPPWACNILLEDDSELIKLLEK